MTDANRPSGAEPEPVSDAGGRSGPLSGGGARFAHVSAVTALEPGRFHADVHPEWTIGGRPNGGYLLALLGRAATAMADHGHVIAASAHYLRPPQPGPVTIVAEVLRAGRSASQVRAQLRQDDQACVEALVTVGQLDEGSAPYWAEGMPPVSHVPYQDSISLVPRLPGLRVAIMEQVEVRIDPDSGGFATGQPSGRGELRGWLTLPGGEAFDPVSLLYAVDAFPPGTLDIELSGWVPTLELTVYVRALPVPGPVRVLQRAQMIHGQRVDESCYVWDQSGRVVAHGIQLAGIRLG